MIPPRYSLVPSAVLRMSHVPIHLRWTYICLYALAWTHEYQWMDETLEQLAETFTALEGKQIEPRGIRQRLTDLAEFGLIERRRVRGRYRTYLRVRHEQRGDVGGVTSEGAGDVVGRHPNSNIAVVVETGIEKEPEDQQQQLVNKAGDVERNEELLEAMGVVGGPVHRLARETHVTPEYLEAIMAYRASEAARGNNLGPGWVVKHVGEGWAVPEVDGEPDRYRYVKGEFKDHVRH